MAKSIRMGFELAKSIRMGFELAISIRMVFGTVSSGARLLLRRVASAWSVRRASARSCRIGNPTD